MLVNNELSSGALGVVKSLRIDNNTIKFLPTSGFPNPSTAGFSNGIFTNVTIGSGVISNNLIEGFGNNGALIQLAATAGVGSISNLTYTHNTVRNGPQYGLLMADATGESSAVFHNIFIDDNDTTDNRGGASTLVRGYNFLQCPFDSSVHIGKNNRATGWSDSELYLDTSVYKTYTLQTAQRVQPYGVGTGFHYRYEPADIYVFSGSLSGVQVDTTVLMGAPSSFVVDTTGAVFGGSSGLSITTTGSAPAYTITTSGVWMFYTNTGGAALYKVQLI
jgi:hypothetical protein